MISMPTDSNRRFCVSEFALFVYKMAILSFTIKLYEKRGVTFGGKKIVLQKILR